jgi:hypothetical protein
MESESDFAPKTLHHSKYVGGVAVTVTARQAPAELSGQNEKRVSTS